MVVKGKPTNQQLAAMGQHKEENGRNYYEEKKGINPKEKEKK